MPRAIAAALLCFALTIYGRLWKQSSAGAVESRTERGAESGSWWQFRQVTAGAQDAESGWLPATVPGDVHLDLLANKKIPDPFYRDNESRLQWIENESWEYRLNFDVTPALLARVQCRHGLRRPRRPVARYF